jgi:ketosteroid isomerase-like protein
MTHGSKEHAEVLQAVRRAINEWRDSINAGDIDRVLNVTADEFEIMLPGQPALVGEKARDMFRDLLGQNTAYAEPWSNEEIILCGEWAIQRLTYHVTFTPKKGGASLTEHGDSIHIFRRQSNGTWRLAKDISTSYAGSHAVTALVPAT